METKQVCLDGGFELTVVRMRPVDQFAFNAHLADFEKQREDKAAGEGNGGDGEGTGSGRPNFGQYIVTTPECYELFVGRALPSSVLEVKTNENQQYKASWRQGGEFSPCVSGEATRGGTFYLGDLGFTNLVKLFAELYSFSQAVGATFRVDPSVGSGDEEPDLASSPGPSKKSDGVAPEHVN